MIIDMDDVMTQVAHRVRCDWGPAGADAVGPGASIVAVVDVLSFTTALTVAADAGIEVFPYRWRDERAAAFAARHQATLAVGRSQVSPDQPVSLSPSTIRAAAREIRRLVLPSPNGSTIARRLAETGSTVIGVSLRNAAVAARWTARRLPRTAAVAVIAAGERWPDGSLRPAVEDLWGAGAYVQSLIDEGVTGVSPEAAAAAAAYRHVAADVRAALLACAGGRELTENGYRQDVEVAAEVGTSNVVPILSGDSFRPILRS